MNENIKVNADIGATIFWTQAIIYIQLYSIFSPLENHFVEICRENCKWPGNDVLVNHLSGNIYCRRLLVSLKGWDLKLKFVSVQMRFNVQC